MNKLEIKLLEPVSVFNPEGNAWRFIKDADRKAAITPPRNRPKVTYEELELMASLRKGEEAAFATLVERYHGRLLRFAQSFVPSQAVAEEVVQETWMAVLKGIHRFEGRSSLKTWIFQSFRIWPKPKERENTGMCHFSHLDILMTWKRIVRPNRNRSPPTGPWTDQGFTSSTTWDEHTPERLLVSKESLSQIKYAIQKLPPPQRQVIILRDMEGLESEEICQLLKITATNQRVLLHRARTKVRQALHSYLQGNSLENLQAEGESSLAVSQ